MTTTEIRSVALPDKIGEAAKIQPVRWWGAFGAFCLVLQAYLYTRWIWSGNFSSTASGPDPIPGWMVVSAHAHEALSISVFCLCGYRLVLKPWRRARSVPTGGMLFLALLTVYWQDLGANYFNHVFTWNTAFSFNRGAWYNFIPGWVSPRSEHLAEPLLFAVSMNVWVIVVTAVLLAKLMAALKRRRPNLGTVGLLTVALAVALPLDLLVEVAWVRLGLYSFAGSIPGFTLFAGHYYQFPVYEALFIGLYFVAFGALLYFRDDKGRSVIERGIDSVRVVRPAQRPWLRFLAFAGFANLALLTYNVAFSITSLWPGFTWNEDTVRHRSYLRNELCGAGTPYACPSEDVPIPRRGGGYVDVDGRLQLPTR